MRYTLLPEACAQLGPATDMTKYALAQGTRTNIVDDVPSLSLKVTT